ncbi:mannose-6-phosphate isomerase, class I [Vibrio fluvialis]|nr:mannose-6-phosphate isomerase, class I [Vibrio fluvialis]EKO3975244.1 mannose-6-phosphate isomerase, class I [Vibrio fluvialis]ELI5720194.1 mannose-6-phosphate isomerase, class I [Vibrio fluvialis]EMA2448358.1 mannose-6-phosphate isomerase, class I [Vibrio fluvialis]MBY7851259.1 mannose-6-phosphate isomerase, class I [Vibrio fluvialis]
MNTITTPFFVMKNKIQNYAWGSSDSIEQLFDIANPNKHPQAEIWMGAHPNGCSEVELNGSSLLLSELIAQDKSRFLSQQTAAQFGELPYLFKVLAAAQALSVQVHPSKEEAQAGYAKENAAGMDIKAANRNYKDPNHKPELVYAITPYQAMNGFRSISSIIDHFEPLKIECIQPLVEELRNNQHEQGLQQFFTLLLSLTGYAKRQAVEKLLAYAQSHQSQSIYTLILELAEQYPNDIGLFAPLMLNVLTLQPGEAMYLDARTPHAYLKGTGLEIMANSDNVLRAGLTPKHMDVLELAKCTRFAEKPESTLLLTPIEQDGALLYPVPVDDFKFALYTKPSQTSVTVSSAEIIFPIDEDATLISDEGIEVTIRKGQSVFVPAYTSHYRLSSAGRVARAYN